jgi:hypothetical protein
MFTRERLWLFVPGIIMTIILGCAQAPPQKTRDSARRSGATASLEIFYSPSGAKVGHHTVFAPRGNCLPSWTSNAPQIVGGYLPPGLKLEGHNIVGTPQLPGTWNVKMRFTGITCQGTSYPDQYVDVNLSIEGDAPRQVQ